MDVKVNNYGPVGTENYIEGGDKVTIVNQAALPAESFEQIIELAKALKESDDVTVEEKKQLDELVNAAQERNKGKVEVALSAFLGFGKKALESAFGTALVAIAKKILGL